MDKQEKVISAPTQSESSQKDPIIPDYVIERLAGFFLPKFLEEMEGMPK